MTSGNRVKITSVLPGNNLLLMRPGSLEKMWAVHHPPTGGYKIESIPAADPDLNLGDVVLVGDDMVIRAIASRGGDVTFHVYWPEVSWPMRLRHRRLRREFVRLLAERFRVSFENYDGSFMGISVPHMHSQQVSNLLATAMLQDEIIDAFSMSGIHNRWE